MIKVFLAVSVACNVWFLFMLLSDRIMETKFVRFLKGISGLWQSLELKEEKTETASVGIPADETDIIGKSKFKMAPTRTTAAIPAQEAATSEKGIELSEEEATFDDGNTEIASRPAQVPEEKLDETFTSMPPSELEYGEDEPDDDVQAHKGGKQSDHAHDVRHPLGMRRAFSPDSRGVRRGRRDPRG